MATEFGLFESLLAEAARRAAQKLSKYQPDLARATGVLPARNLPAASGTDSGAVALSDDDPADVDTSGADPGAAADVSRADHVHALAPTAVTPDTYGDATHVPVITVGADGRITSASETAVTAGATLSSATPEEVDSDAGAAGVASTASRADHVHLHGDLDGGSLHAVATSGDAGFLSAADKDKLDAMPDLSYARQGGDPDDWSVAGTDDQAVPAVLVQLGVVNAFADRDWAAAGATLNAVVFDIEFSDPPHILLTCFPSGGVGTVANLGLIATDQFTFYVSTADTVDGTADVHWEAKGPPA